MHLVLLLLMKVMWIHDGDLSFLSVLSGFSSSNNSNKNNQWSFVEIPLPIEEPKYIQVSSYH